MKPTQPNNNQSFFPGNFTVEDHVIDDCEAQKQSSNKKHNKTNTKMNSPFYHQKVPGFLTLPPLIITSDK